MITYSRIVIAKRSKIRKVRDYDFRLQASSLEEYVTRIGKNVQPYCDMMASSFWSPTFWKSLHNFIPLLVNRSALINKFVEHGDLPVTKALPRHLHFRSILVELNVFR